eukprot:Skav202802  [mRNA]  locus=scaffold326:834611:838825:- [translate_table: standard]
MLRVAELCSGLGGFSSQWSKAGFSVKVGVDQNPCWSDLFKSMHPEDSPDFFASAAGSSETIKKLMDKDMFHCTVLAGVACQPFSVLGDQAGMADQRSGSLEEVLNTAWALQSTTIVLECVSTVMTHVGFQQKLTSFCHATGYALTQQILDLRSTWCTRRERWFGVLTAPAMGQFPVPPMPKDPAHGRVGDVLPQIPVWNEVVMQQLQLDLYELRSFDDFAVGGVQALYLKADGQMATSLHSAGSQLSRCPCGCRSALSMHRLQTKGLLGTLIPLGTFRKHGHSMLQDARNLHPSEMLLLNGGPPDVAWGDNLKLALAGIGQCVSPLVGLWIATHVKQHVERFTCGSVNSGMPEVVVQAFKQSILEAGQLMWPTRTLTPETSEGVISVSIAGIAPVSVAIRTPCTVGDVRAAETALLTDLSRMQACSEDGSHLPDSHPVHPGGDLMFQEEFDDSMSHVSLHEEVGMDDPEEEEFFAAMAEAADEQRRYDESHAPGPHASVPIASVSEVTNDAGPIAPEQATEAEWESAECPEVLTIQALLESRKQMVGGQQRKEEAHSEPDAWADDQVLAALQLVAFQAPKEQHVVVIDPLLATSMVLYKQFGGLDVFLSSVPSIATLISAVAIDDHWLPVMWRLEADQVRGYTSMHGDVPSALVSMHEYVVRSRITVADPMTCDVPGFEVDRNCGAWACMFLQHKVLGSHLPETMNELDHRGHAMVDGFVSQVAEQTPQPWIWGWGETDARLKLEQLLVEHGVVMADVTHRIRLLFDKLGEKKVLDAMNVGQPWRELKWLANQTTPPIQIVKPSELQKVIDERTKNGTVGNRSQRKASKGKGKGKGKTAAIDPAMIKVAPGTFNSATGCELSQLDIAQISPNASGVVLTTPAAASAYLQQAKPMSAGSLAIVVVCVEHAVPDSVIKPQVVQFPVLMRTTEEPMLVTGYLYNLGAIEVKKAVPAKAVAVRSVASCVLKILLYRDQCQLEWRQVAAQPMKAIITLLPILQKCQNEECEGLCELWHPGEKCDLQDPLIEVWSRQWLDQRFNFTSAADSDIFSVHVRVPVCLQVIAQTYSGQQGLFVEPRALDGRGPSDTFHVIWTPKLDLQQLMVLKQSNSNALGIARIGSKLGLRCRAEHAEQLHSAIKPGGTFLPTGKKQLWLAGPLPFGTGRAALSQALQDAGWTARPLQAVPAARHVTGMMYKVQSVQDPPRAMLAMEHGEVLITRIQEQDEQSPEVLQVVGSNRAVNMLQQGAEKVDFMQIHDPWARKPATQQQPTFATNNPMDELESRITSSVMQKLEQGKAMEVDHDEVMSSRVQKLEEQMQDLSVRQEQIQVVVQSNASEQASQIQELQTSVQAQFSQVERAIASNAAQFEAQFQSEAKRQESMLSTMFGRQMEDFEALLAKRQKVSAE